ncbi:MAG: tyrosine-type recombinase/integrase [Lentisphaerae bacterium]|nr:tyrosine-type recombinase/integrase [Lentisphaerota bacterium]
MQRLEMAAYVFPYRSVPYTSSSFLPHIFSNNELSCLFEAADHAEESPYTPFKNMQFALLLRMLYSTGMRVGEIAALKKESIDLDQGLIRIRHAKFDKERTIPVAVSLLERMRQYDNLMRFYPIWEQTEYFFANTVGSAYGTTTIYHCFREYLRKAGISHGGKGVGPRLHDIRHTYAVHCLRDWVRNGHDLTAALPYLSVYMGHVGVRCTQHYLRLTAELYPDIVMKLDASYGWMIPEAGTV